MTTIHEVAKSCVDLGLYINLGPNDKVNVFHGGLLLAGPLSYDEATVWFEGFKEGKENAFSSISKHIHATLKGLK